MNGGASIPSTPEFHVVVGKDVRICQDFDVQLTELNIPSTWLPKQEPLFIQVDENMTKARFLNVEKIHTSKAKDDANNE